MSDVRLKSDIKAPPDPTTKGKGWFVVVVVMIILIAFTTWMVVLLFRESNAPLVIQRCNPGLCAFSSITGIKRCPVDDVQGIEVNLGLEFCTSRDYCQNNNFPCAVQADQSLNCAGVCGAGNEECRCVSVPP